MTIKNVAFIPARGGSKEIPRKNLVELAGRHLIYYSIASAQLSDVNEVWVSTDDTEIADVARTYGASVLFRPAELATDQSPSELALLHFAENVAFDQVAFLQATSPLIDAKVINIGLRLLNSYDSALTVSRNTQFIWTDQGPNYDICNRPRRQEMTPSYLETGGAFFTKRLNLMNSKNRISGRIGYVFVSKLQALDIDTIDDLELVSHVIQSI